MEPIWWRPRDTDTVRTASAVAVVCAVAAVVVWWRARAFDPASLLALMAVWSASFALAKGLPWAHVRVEDDVVVGQWGLGWLPLPPRRVPRGHVRAVVVVHVDTYRQRAGRIERWFVAVDAGGSSLTRLFHVDSGYAARDIVEGLADHLGVGWREERRNQMPTVWAS